MAMAPDRAAAVYSGSKAYVLNFTRSLQLEYAESPLRIHLVLPGPVRTEFFTAQGLTDAVFSADSFISADALVDAALAGLDAGELVTCPTLRDRSLWIDLELARTNFLHETLVGQVASRYAASIGR
jgi:short-subunit dehydrogenase